MKTVLCLGKTIFSKGGADKFKKGRKMSHITKKKMRTYFCLRCKGFHLSTDISKGKNYGEY